MCISYLLYRCLCDLCEFSLLKFHGNVLHFTFLYGQLPWCTIKMEIGNINLKAVY